MSARSRASINAGLSLVSQMFFHMRKKKKRLSEVRRGTEKLVKRWVRPTPDNLFIQSQHHSCLPHGPLAERGAERRCVSSQVSGRLVLIGEVLAQPSRAEFSQPSWYHPGRESPRRPVLRGRQQWRKGRWWWWLQGDWVQKCLLAWESRWTFIRPSFGVHSHWVFFFFFFLPSSPLLCCHFSAPQKVYSPR